MEVGARHNGLYDPLATNAVEARCSLGDSRPAHEVGTFLSRADDIDTGGILPVVYPRDRPTIWSASIHSVGQRPKVYDALLEEFPKGHRHPNDHEYNFPPTDRWSVREDHTGVRGHAEGMRPGS